MVELTQDPTPTTPTIETAEYAIEPDMSSSPEKKQMMMVVGGFILLPIVILGGFFLYKNVASGNGSDELAEVTQTVTQRLLPTDAPTSTPIKTTGTPTPKVSATPAKSPTPTTPTKLANLYFHSSGCTYKEGSSSASVRPTVSISGKEFTSSTVPDDITCTYIMQNGEDVETGEFKYVVTHDTTTVKTEDVGKLKKGNYPNSEFKSGEVKFDPFDTTGTHKIKIEINPDKKFSESNTGDNVFEVSYKVN